jgi:hypothetical protein
MKSCKKIKNLMVDAVYNQLPEAEQAVFHEHLKTCPACSAEYHNMEKLMSMMNKRQRPQMNEDYWEQYSQKLDEKLDAIADHPKPAVQTHRQRRWFAGSSTWTRWVLMPAASVALLVMAVSIVRFFSLSGGKAFVDTAVSSIRQLTPAVAEHFDNIKPMLIDYANYTPEEETDADTEPGETVAVDKTTIQKLLLENRMLKRVVANSDDITAKQLMEELELILMEISNSNGDKAETLKAVRQLIKDNDILFKMKVLKEKGEQSPSI